MPSKAERIAARVAALLTGTTTAGTNVWRDRDDALTREESPALLIELGKEDEQTLGGPGRPGALNQCDLEIHVITCVRGAAWQTVADAVRVQASALVMADAELRGLVASIRRSGTEWQSKSTDLPFGYAAQTFTCKYMARADSLDLDP